MNTIETHLSFYIARHELQIADFVTSQKLTAIQKVIEEFGSGSMKVLKDNLPANIDYGEIRMVLADMAGNEA